MRPRARAFAMLLLLGACSGDDERTLLPSTAATQQGVPVVTSELQAGTTSPLPASDRTENPYVDDEHALAAGRQLYGQMNCAGCHGPQGGGGIGPPFADAEWIYGGEPENIVQAILQGRPNGMPAYGGKLPASEAWKIAAYVKHLNKVGESKSGAGDSPAIGSAKGSSTAGRGP